MTLCDSNRLLDHMQQKAKLRIFPNTQQNEYVHMLHVSFMYMGVMLQFNTVSVFNVIGRKPSMHGPLQSGEPN